MSSVRPLSFRSLALAAALIGGALAASPAPAQEGRVIATIAGVPITSFDIPQRQRLLQIREGRPHSAEQALQDLINDRIKFAEARRFRVEANEQQVETAYAQVAQRSGIDPRGFDQVLRSQGIEPRVYKGKLRADLSWSNLIGARYGRTIFITDTQLVDALNRRQGATRPVNYVLRPVVLLVPRTPPPPSFRGAWARPMRCGHASQAAPRTWSRCHGFPTPPSASNSAASAATSARRSGRCWSKLPPAS